MSYLCLMNTILLIKQAGDPMTDIEKLIQAQRLLSDIYNKYGDLLKDNYSICSQMSCADSCIIETIDYLTNFTKEIGHA